MGRRLTPTGVTGTLPLGQQQYGTGIIDEGVPAARIAWRTGAQLGVNRILLGVMANIRPHGAAGSSTEVEASVQRLRQPGEAAA